MTLCPCGFSLYFVFSVADQLESEIIAIVRFPTSLLSNNRKSVV